METYDEVNRSILNDSSYKGLILSTAYLPPISFFFYLFEFNNKGLISFIESNENFVKQTFRNRAYIADSNGLHCISIPIESNGGEKIGIKDVLLSSHKDWRHEHINAIRTAYGSSPFYEYYQEDLERVINKPYKRLWDLNEDLINTIMEISNMDLSFDYTDVYEKTTEYLDLRYSLNPKKNDINDSRISNMTYYDTSNSRDKTWIEKLSFLDLLFNMGPEWVLIFNKVKK